MKRLVVVLGLLVGLGTGPAAQAATPIPWCGTDVVSADRLPDATFGFAVHVIYAHPPGSPARFAEWAPRIAGDVAAIDAWWRTQDAGRAPRFDLFAFPCSSVFGALDISRVALPAAIGPIGQGFGTLRDMLSRGFNASEKVYLLYYDGPTGQSGNQRICGAGAAPFTSFPGLAIVLLDSCGAEATDSLRPVVAVHELVHVLGAVEVGAPHLCMSGHVCDVPNDLLASRLLGTELERLVLDGGRDDYYGHSGTWPDIQDSLFLERLDSPDRAPPSTPAGLNATGPAAGGSARFSWSASSDDVGPVAYRVTRDGRFVGTVRSTSATFPNVSGKVTRLSVRAVDAVGHLGPPAELFFRGGLGVVDAQGRLVRDTVRPPAIGSVATIRLPRVVVLSWRGVR
ncbi:MAG: hypothetical protein H0V68_01475, partial [Actinobacteria bacterium]|nr:hypothetical protein [Actinomycetota bacterium]